MAEQKKSVIDREAVKTLAIAVGVREAARQLGLPQATVQAWSARDKWFAQPQLPPTVLKPNSATIATRSPSAGLQHLLETRKTKVKSNLSEYLVNASKVAKRSRSPLEDSSDVKNVASVMAAIWPEKEEQGSGVMGGLRVYSDKTVINVQTHEDDR